MDRIHISSPFPLLAAVGARTKTIEIGTAVIDMRYENPLYMAEDAGAADIIAGGRLQLGISRGSPEQVIDGWRHFGYAPRPRRDATPTWRVVTPRCSSTCSRGRASRSRTRGRCFPIRRGCCASSRISEGLRDRIWWGSSSNATSQWAAKLGMNLQSSTLKDDESGEPLHVQQRKQIEAYREAWKEAGHAREPRVSVSRSIFALVDDRDRAYFGRDGRDQDQIGYIDANTRAIFGRSYAAEPDVLVKQLAADEAIAAADTLLLTVPNQLGRGLQRARDREHPEVRRSGTRLALIATLLYGKYVLSHPFSQGRWKRSRRACLRTAGSFLHGRALRPVAR